MSGAEVLADLEKAFRAAGLDELEVYLKSGRSRRFEIGPQGRIAGFYRERGWAVRAGSRRASLFAAGTGLPVAAGPWPRADGAGLRLPSPGAVPAWTAPPGLDAPLVVESEAIGLLEAIERELGRELAGARLLRAVLEDGSSESELASSRGVEGSVRARSAALSLEVAGPGAAPARASYLLARRSAGDFNPRSLARRIADRLTVCGQAGEVGRDRGEMLLAPPVAIALVRALLPLWVGRGAAAAVAALRDRRGRIGGRALTVIDDGRLPKGLFSAPIDGEGVATREVAIVEEGTFRRPLLSWREAAAGESAAGCVRRPSWRDLPAPGPTHLFLRPDPAASVADLLASVARGFYLLEPLGPARVELAEDRFSLPVCGFVVRRGRASAALANARLCGGVRALLQGVQATARDLEFRASDGMIGAPSTLVAGLELRPAG